MLRWRELAKTARIPQILAKIATFQKWAIQDLNLNHMLKINEKIGLFHNRRLTFRLSRPRKRSRLAQSRIPV